MVSKIIAVLEHHAFGMGLVFILWIILFDKTAITKVNKPSVKRSIYAAIIIYYLMIVVEIIIGVKNK
jgi:hypothetical protein